MITKLNEILQKNRTRLIQKKESAQATMVRAESDVIAATDLLENKHTQLASIDGSELQLKKKLGKVIFRRPIFSLNGNTRVEPFFEPLFVPLFDTSISLCVQYRLYFFIKFQISKKKKFFRLATSPRCAGSGTYGFVFLATWHGSRVAVKTSKQMNLTTARMEKFMREAKILAVLSHENCGMFRGICMNMKKDRGKEFFLAYFARYCLSL